MPRSEGARGPRWPHGLILALVFLSACASTGPSVRALRMVDHETPTPSLVRLHIRQMADSLALIEKLLGAEPYTPGASWITSLPLDDARVARARETIADLDEKASLVAVYVKHIDAVLDEKSRTPLAPPGAASSSGIHYPSIREALATVSPSLTDDISLLRRSLSKTLDGVNSKLTNLTSNPKADAVEVQRVQLEQMELAEKLSNLQADLARPVGPEDLRDPEHARIVQDALAVASVALRLAQEAIGLGVVIGLEMASLAQQGPTGWFRNPASTADLIAGLPDDAREIYGRLQNSAASLGRLLGELSRLSKVTPLETVGFQFKEGLANDIAGFAWDSVHVDLHAGGQALFYNALEDNEQTTGGQGATYNYTGRLTKLEYKVEPIVVTNLSLDVKVDWAHWADAVGLKLGYATNRTYKSGGDFSQSSLANELGVSGTASDALSAALAIARFKVRGQIAHFNHGVVRDILVADGSVLAESPFVFDYKVVDAVYDLAPSHTPLKTLTLGFRYFDYTLPRILYELVNSTPDAGSAAYVYSRETPPQAIRTRFYMLNLSTRVEKPWTPRLSPHASLDVAFGYGPTEYYFLRDLNVEDIPSNRENSTSNGMGLGLAGALGIRWQFLDPHSRLNAYLNVDYHAQLLTSLLDSKNSGNTVVNIGMRDLFHGPSFSLGLTY